MDMADYSEALDPAYTTLEFENMQVLPLGTGESDIHAPPPLLNFETFTDFKTLVGRDKKKRKKKGVICPSAPARRGMIPLSGRLLSS